MSRKIDALAESASLVRQAEEWVSGAEESPRADGYQLVDDVWSIELMRQAARIATARIRGTGTYAPDRDDALSGVMMAVAINPNISFKDAIYEGVKEAQAQLQSRVQMHGKTNRKQLTDETGHAKTGKRFEQFWNDDLTRDRFVHPDAIDVWLTLSAVWVQLDDASREALAFVAFDNANGWPERLAKELGCSVSVAYRRFDKARRAALRLWFDTETPHIQPYGRAYARADTCAAGHDLTNNETVSFYRPRGQRFVRQCVICKRERAMKSYRKHSTGEGW